MLNTKSTLRSVWGEYGAEALWTTLSAMIPAVLIGSLWGIDLAVPFVIGALNASMTDFPGHRKEKVHIAAWNSAFAVLTVLIIGYILPHTWILIPLVAALAGIFTLMGALGSRIMMVGVTSLFMMTFVIGLRPPNILNFAFLAGLGTAWFYIVNICHTYVDPFWEARKALANGFRHTVALLRIKAMCYDPHEPLNNIYQQVGAISIKLADQHEAIRHLLLREEFQHKQKSDKEYALWYKGYVLMDLYSLANAVDHDYNQIRQQLGEMDMLDQIKRLVNLTADAVELLENFDTQNEQEYLVIRAEIEAILDRIQKISTNQNVERTEILSGALSNARTFITSIERLRHNKGDDLVNRFYARSMDVSEFLPPLVVNLKSISEHIRLRTPLFLFSLRMILLFFLGGIAGYLLSEMKYTYWIFMTIIVVARPSYSLTRQRNKHRIWGTIGGLLLGLFAVIIIKNVYILLFLVAFLIFAFLLFNRRIYMISVFFITASVVIALHLHEGSYPEILTNRILFTLIGSALAFLGWFIIPIRNVDRIGQLVQQALQESKKFYKTVRHYLETQNPEERYVMRVGRKQAFLSLTKLSDGLIQLQKEPGHSPGNMQNLSNIHNDIYQLHAMIANLAVLHDYDPLFEKEKVKNHIRFERIEILIHQIDKKITDAK